MFKVVEAGEGTEVAVVPEEVGAIRVPRRVVHLL